jgi:hypothetical protein
LSSKIEVVNLERGERYDGADRPLQPFVNAPSLNLTVYADWPFAEQEVKRRCLEVLAARAAVPDGVAFVRTWESVPAIVEPLARPDDNTIEVPAADAFVPFPAPANRGRRARR